MTVLNIKELVAERAKSVKFEAHGDSGEGRVTAAEMVDDLNGGSAQIPVITLENPPEEKKLWARSQQMLEAINAALDRIGATGLEIGDWLKVTYVADKTLRSGRSMKVYEAEVIRGADLEESLV